MAKTFSGDFFTDECAVRFLYRCDHSQIFNFFKWLYYTFQNVFGYSASYLPRYSDLVIIWKGFGTAAVSPAIILL